MQYTIVLLILPLIHCQSSQYNAWPPTTCDPLVPEFCSLPWPNDYWLIKDDNYNPIHLNFTEYNLPVSMDGKTIDPYPYNQVDGWTPLPAILAYWNDVSIDNCARLWNISQSNENDSPIIILETNTNKRIPHWVELDHSSDDRKGEQRNRTLMIWPAYRLKDSTRYIIAIRYLKDSHNNPIQISNAFKALRDNISTNITSINERRDYFNKYIFNILSENGIDRNTLQLSWDFTVQSTQTITTTMITMRDDAFSRIKNGNVNYRIEAVIDYPTDIPYAGRKINGTMSVPWYLNTRIPDPEARIVRNINDYFLPVFQREEQVEFEVIIPRSILNGSIVANDSRYVQFGHGLFHNYREVEYKYITAEANKFGYILGAVSWLGLSSQDVPIISDIIMTNLTNFPYVVDRSHQGTFNASFAVKLLLTPSFYNSDFFKNVNNNQRIINEPFNRNYFGNSLGGIYGSVYMSLTTDVKYGVVSVPGFPFSLLLPRSVDFRIIFDVLKERYKNDVDRIMILSWFDLIWTQIEPAGFISHLNKDPLIGTPIHNVLVEFALGDAQVTWLGGQALGRSLNCFMYNSDVSEGNETLYGFNWIDDNVVIDTNHDEYHNACMIQGWNYNMPIVPFVNLAPNRENDTHEYNKLQPTTQEENYKFFVEGIIYNGCHGPCNGNTTI